MKTKYRVAGGRAVCGVRPGGTVDIDVATTRVNVDALVKAGHLREVKPEPKPKPRED